MDIKELRIGNHLETYVGNITEVSIATLESIAYNRGIYKPIPLTEEWLISFGFTKTTPRQDWHTNAYEIPSWGRVSIVNGVLKSDEYYFLDGMTNEIKYVHQLQNLYFALTDNELVKIN